MQAGRGSGCVVCVASTDWFVDKSREACPSHGLVVLFMVSGHLLLTDIYPPPGWNYGLELCRLGLWLGLSIPRNRRHMSLKTETRIKGRIILQSTRLEMAVVKDKHIKKKPIIYVLFVFDLDGDCKFIKNRTFSWSEKYVPGWHPGWMNRKFCLQKGGSHEHISFVFLGLPKIGPNRYT